MLIFLGIIVFIIVLGVIIACTQSSLKTLDDWTENEIIRQAEALAYNQRNPSPAKIRKYIRKLGPIATRDKNAEEVRNYLKSLL